MLTLRPTKTLARRLGIKLPDALPVVTNRVADWCAHEFRSGRFTYLSFFNTASLYPVLTHARGVNDDRELIKRLQESTRLQLPDAGFAPHVQRWIEPDFSAVQWAPIPDQAVLGSMTDLIKLTKHDLEDGAYSLVEIAQRLAMCPMSILGMNSPDTVVRNLRAP